MLQLLIFLVVIGIVIISLAVGMVINLISSLFGLKRQPNSGYKHEKNSATTPKKQKVFEKEEGEYIDFEEIKE